MRCLWASPVFFGAAVLLLAQTPKPPAIVSPEVLEDRRVVFRLYAPQAAEVLLTGDWMGPRAKPLESAKGDDRFFVLEQKSHPAEKERGTVSSAQRFEGYVAEHYLVRLDANSDELRKLYKELPDRLKSVKRDEVQAYSVEIQVGSLPLHAWSEVNHDCVYKPFDIEQDPNKREDQFDGELRALLDAINGHAIAMEVLLDTLKWKLHRNTTILKDRDYEGQSNAFRQELSKTLRKTTQCLWIGQNLHGTLN